MGQLSLTKEGWAGLPTKKAGMEKKDSETVKLGVSGFTIK
jgi:hypothetical protein